MKKLTGVLIAASMVLFQFCGNKKAQVAVPKLTYEGNVKALIETKCAPCHVPPRGNKRPYVSFDNVKEDIDEILRRVQLNPADRGFMPLRSPQKLPDSVINVLLQWKTDGMLEK